MKRYQFVNWFPEWRGFGLLSFKTPPRTEPYVYIFDWIISIGFWEIRKWRNGYPDWPAAQWIRGRR